jgi:hypothetical protein
MGMAQFVLPDPDKLGHSEPIDIPDHDVHVPVKLTESGRTRKEWDDLIRRHKLPLIIHDEGKGEG